MVVTDFERGAKLEGWQKALENPTRTYKRIAVILWTGSQQAFQKQRFGKTGWKPRAVPNVFGILQDFERGRTKPQKHRFEPRPVLKDSGDLKRKTTPRWSRRYAEVGNNLPYAAVMHEGGTVQSVEITEDIQRRLSRWLSTPEGQPWQKDLKHLTDPKKLGSRITANVEARPFVGITRGLRRRILSEVGVAIFEVGRSGV